MPESFDIEASISGQDQVDTEVDIRAGGGPPVASVGRLLALGAPEAHKARLKPKCRQPSTWFVSPELCARSRDRAAKHAAGRQRGAPVGAVKPAGKTSR
eukprot:scaffold19963_cov102-Phaeocystis_antarctica.AAC.2